MSTQTLGWSPMSPEDVHEWERMQLGETRAVYARDKRKPPDAPLVFMPEGEADRFREDARMGHLVCPVPGCRSPRLMARHYEDRRDHFAHVCGEWPSHPDLSTVVVRHMLRRWAASLDGQDEVLDEQTISGVPVTVLARLAGGEQVALCYVDGCLGVDAWQRQRAALERCGVTGVWIFKPNERYFKACKRSAAGARGLIFDTRLFRAMRDQGCWPLFVNPERERVAKPIVREGEIAVRFGLHSPLFVRNTLQLASSKLEDCRLCKDGMVTAAVLARNLEEVRAGSPQPPRERAAGHGPVLRGSDSERLAAAAPTAHAVETPPPRRGARTSARRRWALILVDALLRWLQLLTAERSS